MASGGFGMSNEQEMNSEVEKRTSEMIGNFIDVVSRPPEIWSESNTDLFKKLILNPLVDDLESRESKDAAYLVLLCICTIALNKDGQGVLKDLLDKERSDEKANADLRSRQKSRSDA